MSFSAEPPYFVVDLENQKLVSGEISFAERNCQKLRRAIFCLILAPIIGVLLWLFFSSDYQIRCVTYFLIAVFVAIPLQKAISDLYAARLYRQLAGGQFLDGQIVSSKLGWYRRGRGWAFLLTVTYRFQTPYPEFLQRTTEVPRGDLWKQAHMKHKGFDDFNPNEEDYKRLQTFAPPPHTPIKIRYVNDFLFRVM